MSKPGMLQDKHAVVFGGGGSIGSAVAKEFASEGAEVFLAGRSSVSVDLAAKEITAAGGRAHSEVVDALDAAAVDDYLAAVVERAGSIDIEFNATGPLVSEYGHGKPVVELDAEQFMTPLATVLRSQFITGRAAARRMLTQESGVIIFLSAIPGRVPVPGSAGIAAAYGALESVTRTMALELGPVGVRVVCLRTTANPDTRTIQDTAEMRALTMHITPEQVMERFAEATMLKVLPRAADTAKAVALLASDGARMMTGTVLNASAGAVVD